MKKYINIQKQFFVQITKDYMMIVMCFAPFLAAAAMHFGIPFLEEFLTSYFYQSQILVPYYYLFNILIGLLTPILFSFVGAMVVLTEKDETIVKYMSVTPVGLKGYMFSRIIFPALVGFIINIVNLLVFHVCSVKFAEIIIYSLFMGAIGVTISLLIIAISTNKVEGMAVGKLSSIVGFAIFIPVVIKSNVQYLCAFLPSFWLGKYIVTKVTSYLFVGVVVFILWLYTLSRKIKIWRIK